MAIGKNVVSGGSIPLILTQFDCHYGLGIGKIRRQNYDIAAVIDVVHNGVQTKIKA